MASTPLTVPRSDQTPALALARVEREERHGYASIGEHLVARKDTSWLRLWAVWVKSLAR